MGQEKYIGMDVHQATIAVAVMDAGGKLMMECPLKELGRSYLTITKDVTRVMNRSSAVRNGKKNWPLPV